MPDRRGRLLAAALVAAAVLAAPACAVGQGRPLSPHPSSAPAAGAGAQLLATLTVAPEDTAVPYDRDQWGGWASQGHGCNTRELVLRDQGIGELVDDACRSTCPAAGPVCWTSVYDDAGAYDPADLQIDHRVALAEAHRSGTRDWTNADRKAFANDTRNLVAVTSTSNRAKSDADPGRGWRPAAAHWHAFAIAYVRTKADYALTIDPAERDALLAMLGR